MTDMDETDRTIEALFRDADRAPDDAFVERIHRAVLIEQRIAAARAAAWRRFGSEAAAGAAVVLAFVLLGRIVPAGGSVDLLSAGPAMAAGLLILSWLMIGMRPAATGG